LATNLSAPAGDTPTFTWTYPSGDNGSNYIYQFTLWDANGNVIWQIPSPTTGSAGFYSGAIVGSWISFGTDPTIPAGATSLTNPPVNPFTGATLSALSSGTYTWAITTIDPSPSTFGNSAQQQATLTAP
jgi:hypothetical protein